MHRLIAILSGFVLAHWSSLAHAREPAPALPLPSEALQQFLQDAEAHRKVIEGNQRERQLQRATPAPAPSENNLGGQATGESPGGPCWRITGLQLTGNRLIGDEALRHAIQPLLEPCLNPGQINRILARVTLLYTEAGYVTSRPLLLVPPTHGQPLELAIEEGFVEAIELAGEDLPVSLAAAFPGMIGQPLELRTLEQGLDQLNRLRSVDLAADIMPGDLPGGSRIVLRSLQRLPRWQLNAGLDNGGSPGTGRNRISLNAGFDNPLERNDSLSLYGLYTPGEGRSGSATFGLYYSIPYGPWNFSAAANRLRYRSMAKGVLGPIETSGVSTLLSYSLERALWRDQRRLLSATLRLDDKHNAAYLLSQRIAVQSPRYQSIEAGLNGLWLGDATWSGFAGYSRGLGGWSGNDGRRYKDPDAQRARYGKWRASLSRTASYTWGGLRWTLANSWAGQYSANRLPHLEAMALASTAAVRGFHGQPADTANGLAWRNTLYLPFALDGGLRFIPSLGLDAGWADNPGRTRAGLHTQPARGERLLGASLGASLEHRHGSLAVDYQHSLYRRNAPLAPGYWQLSLQLRF